MKKLLLLPLIWLCSPAFSQLPFIATKAQEARALSDSFARYSGNELQYKTRYTELSPSTKTSFIYESKRVDSNGVNWSVVKAHKASGALTKNWQPPKITVSVDFMKEGDQYKFHQMKGYPEDIFPFWLHFIDPSGDIEAIKEKRRAKAIVPYAGKNLNFLLADYGGRWVVTLEN